MKEPKITITGYFTSTGEEWCETANNKEEFVWCLDHIYGNFENCGIPRHMTIKGKTPKYVVEQMGHAFVRESVTNI